jgi:8-amino-7-oxononanoate synthase
VISLAQRFRRGLAECGIGETDRAGTGFVTSIIPVILGEAARALEVSKRLENQGFLVLAIRPPTVPPGTARLRVTFSASHEEAQVDALVSALAGALAA